MVEFLWQPRPLWVLLTVTAAIGVICTLAILPVDVVLGRSEYWQFPVGTVPGGINDVATVLVGYTYLVRSPWDLPLLHVAHLVHPAGTNVFWLDSVPWVGLLGKITFSITGVAINFLGTYLFLCFVLPGVAMATLLWNAGQKSFIAVVAGAILADTAPFLTFSWGHPALCSQYLLILALSLYLASLRQLSPPGPGRGRVAALWFGLLALTMLTSIYLFVMVGGIWVASIMQRWWARRETVLHLSREFAIIVGCIVGLMLVTGILSRELQSAGAPGFGVASINLASPFIPQRSGLIPPLTDYFVGMRSQVFAYLGLGTLFLFVLGLPVMLRWLWQSWGAHSFVLAVLGAYYLFALSHRVFLGGHLLVEIPLPDTVVRMLGAFRGSGRFFWPIGYAMIAGGIIAACTRFSPRINVGLLAIVSIVQLFDARPLREAMAASVRQPVPAVLDRAKIAAIVADATRVMVLPSAACLTDDPLNPAALLRPWQATMEIQLAAARLNLPINSTYTARQLSDCAAEAAALHKPLVAGVAYFYIEKFMPTAGQLGGRKPADVCFPLDWMHYCLVPATAGAR